MVAINTQYINTNNNNENRPISILDLEKEILQKVRCKQPATRGQRRTIEVNMMNARTTMIVCRRSVQQLLLQTRSRRTAVASPLSSLFVIETSSSCANSSLFSLDYCHRRWMTTNASTDDDDADAIQSSSSRLLYTSSMGNLISRLKIVSISSCFMSIVGLPALIFLKNGALPTAQQMGLGGVAFLGATGSTIALHFVF